MSYELECPYCEAVLGDPDDCSSPMEDYQHECHECGKSFMFQVEYEKTYDARKADCLNGAEHDYKPTNTIPKEYARLRCSECGDEKPMPKEISHAAEK